MWDSLLILFRWPNCLVFVYFIVFAAALGRWILQPINVKGGRLRAPTQYLLTDFVWLVLQLQLAFGFCVSWIGVEQPRLFPVVLGFLVSAVTLLWWFGIGCMSRAGVMQPARRAMCTLLLLPAALGVMISLPALIVLLGVLETDLSLWGDLSVPLREYDRYKVLLWIVTPLLPVIGWMLRQIAFWIVRDAHAVQPAEVPVSNIPHGEH